MTDVNGSRAPDLANRANAVAANLEQLCAERRALALNAAQGDKIAATRIAAIDTLAAKLLATQATLLDALRAAEEQDRERQAERERADRQRHLAEANKVAASFIKSSEEIDAAMMALARLFEHRTALLSQLSRTNCLPVNLAHRLGNKSAATGAAKAARLHHFVSLELTPAGQARRLGDAASTLRNALALPAQPTSPPPSPPPTRYRLGGNHDDELLDAAR
jgi:hypothetical protein